MKSITVKELADLLSSNDHIILIDVRWQDEWDDGHIPEAEHIPLDRVEEHIHRFKGKTVYMYCRTGGRSCSACNAFTENNIDAYNVEGGILAWKAAGYPLAH